MLYITLRQYEYVVAVAETASLTAAAARLNVSQPSLSVAISRVEEIVGYKIFQRSKGAALVITPAGHRFIDKARDLLRLADEVENAANRPTPFGIGCFEDIAPWYLSPLLRHLQERFPEEHFQGREGRFADLAQDVAEGRIQLAVSYDVGLDGPFEQRKLREVAPVVFVAADHPLARADSVTLEELAGYPLILSGEELSENYIQDLFERHGLIPEVAHRTGSLEMMRSRAAHWEGVGISYSCPPGHISYDGREVITRPVATLGAQADIILFWSALDEKASAHQQIIEAIAAYFRAFA